MKITSDYLLNVLALIFGATLAEVMIQRDDRRKREQETPAP